MVCYGTVTDLVQGLSLRAWHMYIDMSFLPPPSSPHLDIWVYRQSNRTGVRSLYYSAIFLDWLSRCDIILRSLSQIAGCCKKDQVKSCIATGAYEPLPIPYRQGGEPNSYIKKGRRAYFKIKQVSLFRMKV